MLLCGAMSDKLLIGLLAGVSTAALLFFLYRAEYLLAFCAAAGAFFFWMIFYGLSKRHLDSSS